MKNTMIPDSIWINAHIQTMDDSLPSAQAFAVAGEGSLRLAPTMRSFRSVARRQRSMIWRGILFTPDLSKAICTFRCMVTAC